MIKSFNDVPVRSSGIIYNSVFEQIKKMHKVDPDTAGELAISAIEMILTGQISSDNHMIDMMLTPTQIVNKDNIDKYEEKVRNAKIKKIKELKLDEVADMFFRQDKKQREIADRLGMSQQNVSYRISVIRSTYPELIDEGIEAFYKNTKNTNDTKNEDFVNFVEFYKNTKNTKNENFVKMDDYKNTNDTNNEVFVNFVKDDQDFTNDTKNVDEEVFVNFVEEKQDFTNATKNTKKQNFVPMSDSEFFVKNPSNSGKTFFDF